MVDLPEICAEQLECDILSSPAVESAIMKMDEVVLRMRRQAARPDDRKRFQLAQDAASMLQDLPRNNGSAAKLCHAKSTLL